VIDWQASVGSHAMRAVSNAPLPGGVSFTSLYSRSDEVVVPEPQGSTLPGATNIAIQSVCPTRIADHILTVIDSVNYALAIDAISHPGPANPARLTGIAKLCEDPFMPDVDWAQAATALPVLTGFVQALGTGFLTAEPPLPAYAARYGN
jgi:hypothetical protein